MKEGRRIRIGMMQIMPIFDVAAWGDIEEKFGGLKEAFASIQKEKGWQRPTAEMISILCNRALEIAGDKPELTGAKVLRVLSPKEAFSARTACVEAINRGMKTEHKSEDEHEHVDLVLREIEKKENPEASATGKSSATA